MKDSSSFSRCFGGIKGGRKGRKEFNHVAWLLQIVQESVCLEVYFTCMGVPSSRQVERGPEVKRQSIRI